MGIHDTEGIELTLVIGEHHISALFWKILGPVILGPYTAVLHALDHHPLDEGVSFLNGE